MACWLNGQGLESRPREHGREVMSQPMTQKTALDVLCLACTTLVTDGKIVAGSKLAQDLMEAAEVLGAFRHHRGEGPGPMVTPPNS